MAHAVSDLEIEQRKQTEEERNPNQERTLPKFFQKIDLTPEQEKRLVKEIQDEFEAIRRERDDERLETKWDNLDAQYDGDIQEQADQQFNLHRHTTRVKVDAIIRAVKEAFFESDPVFAITPLPETARKRGFQVAERQEDYLDYKLDTTIPFEEPLVRVLKSAALKGTGILKWKYDIVRQKKKRDEIYRGQPIPLFDTNNQPVFDEQGNPVIKNDELQRFVQNYPDAFLEHPSIVERLANGETIAMKVEFKDTIYDDPLPESVNLKNFYVRSDVKGFEGLKSTKLTLERQTFTWWELQKMVREEKFDAEKVEQLKFMGKGDDKKERPQFESEKFEILECNVFFDLENSDDSDPVKLVTWFHEEQEILLSTIQYPYDGIDCYYIPHYVSQDREGFYQEGIGSLLTDINIAEDLFLNFMLEALWIANTTTPITPEGSEVDVQFLEKRWNHGTPINAKPGEIDFLQNKMQRPDINAMSVALGMLARDADDATGISGLKTGRESPLDPQAPATKTIALLEQSGINIKDYVKSLLPAFNRSANVILQLTYQMTKEGENRAFRRRRKQADTVAGGDIFEELTRQDMIARTNIQAKAHAFDFDRLNAKREDLALLQILSGQPLFINNPDAVHAVLKQVVKSWSAKWKHLADKILPTPEELQQMKQQAALQALATVLQQVQADSELTGQPPAIDPNVLVQAITQMQSEIATPPSEDVLKEREKNAQVPATVS